MLTDQQWNEIRAYTDQVCNRESDDTVFQAGRVRRMPGNGVAIVLDPLQVDLEPLPEDDAPGRPVDGRLMPSNEHPVWPFGRGV